MKNWFVIVGPKEDFAEIKDLNASVAFNTIARVKTSFISRGDNSGTHKRELQLWKDAGFDSPPQNESWYLSTGQGMAATLTIASELKGYALTEEAKNVIRNFGRQKFGEPLFTPFGSD